MTHWLLVHGGILNASGRWYLWWSGIAGDLPMLGILGVVYRRHACHVSGCWRLGSHPIDGSPLIVCRRHHPDVPSKVTPEHVEQAAAK